MKRAGGLFDRLHEFHNLVAAAREARAGKRYRPDVLRFEFTLEDELHRLGRRIREETWTPAPHRHFRILDPKPRWISAAPYGDRVVHHALCRVIEPVLDRRYIFDSWANRRGKGTHRAVLRYQRFACRHRYALKADLRRYFPSIDHELLKAAFRRVFRERRLLALMDRIVDHGRVPEPNRAYFPGDDLFAPFERGAGLPIGNLTSQLWANLYLDGFDHWVKEGLRAPAYLRFVDDFVLLHDSPAVLREWIDAARLRLEGLRLRLHEAKSVVRRVDEGLPLLGYVVWPDRIRVRGGTVRRFRRRARLRARRDGAPPVESLAAWRGHVSLAGTWRRAGL